MNILLICNDYYHPGKVVSEGLAFLRGEGHTLEEQDDAAAIKADAFKRKEYDVIVLSKSDEISAENRQKWETPELQRAFTEYVENGGGLFAIHSGLVGDASTQKLRTLIGSRFTHHPEQCPVTVCSTKAHPITEGVSEFVEIDEHYFIEMLIDDADVLMHSQSRHGRDIACYIRTQGKGRICAFTPGHNPWVWQNPAVRQLVRNTLQWLK